jgi:hypothetical protein
VSFTAEETTESSGRFIIRDHGTRRTLWSGKRNVRRLKRRDGDWSLLCFKFPTITCTSTLLCNLKALLTMLAFIEPNVIERRQSVDNSTVLGSFNVRVDLMRRFEDIQKVLIRQRMI